MDYLRIYRDLIADRLTKQPPKQRSPANYFEVHHITPKCMGGKNNKDNLIRLTADDHFFVHYLLAKAYRGTEFGAALWCAVRLMADMTYRQRRKGPVVLPRAKRLYADIRKNHIIHAGGENHRNTVKTLFRFISRDGMKRYCTMNALCREFSLDVRLLFKICIEKSRKTTKGWTLQSLHDATGFHWEQGAAPERNPLSDKTVRQWRHRDGRDFSGTNIGLVLHGNRQFTATALSHVVKGKNATVGGWYLPSQHDVFPSRTMQKRRKPAITLVFKHADGRAFSGPRWKFIEMSGATQSEIVNLLRGVTLNVRGWMLPDTDPARVNLGGIPPKKVSAIYGTVRHPTLGDFSGNASEFRTRFYPAEVGTYSNISVGQFAAIVQHGGSWKQWRRVEPDGTVGDGLRAGIQMVFKNANDNQTFVGNQARFREHIGASSGVVNAVARKGGTYKGWSLVA